MKEKNLSIELLKFIAVIIVLNSHLDVLYGKYDFLATGGAIGDSLFFFVSGFTIFLGRFGRFDNWYKRRIRRIYPSVIAWAAIMSVVSLEQQTVGQLLIGGGYWFVSCIMLYYVLLFFVRKYAPSSPVIPFLISSAVVIVWFLFEDKNTLALYGGGFIKWGVYFLFMLFGAYIGNGTFKIKTKPLADSLFLLLSLVLFYGIQFTVGRFPIGGRIQLLSIVPLMGVVLFVYKLCCTEQAIILIHSKIGLFMRTVAGLCLEAYIVQVFIIPVLSDPLLPLFPFSLLIVFVVVMILAYLTRCLGRIILQLFQSEDMDWRAAFSIVD